MSTARYRRRLAMQQMDTTLVTPEAVVLQFETAGLGSRMLARVLDSLIQFAGLLAILLVVVIVSRLGVGSTPLTIVLLFSVFAVIFLYPILFETLWRGGTPRKKGVGLRGGARRGGARRCRHGPP